MNWNEAIQQLYSKTHAMTPRADYKPYTPEQIRAIKAQGKITRAAKWDSANREERAAMFPQLNPCKRWFEQKAYEKVN